MNKLTTLTCMLPALLLAACTGNASKDFEALETATTAYHDTTKIVVVDLSLELPTGTDAAAQLIRDTLMQHFAEAAQWPFFFGDEDEERPAFPEYTGEKDDVQAFVNHYGNEDMKLMMLQALDLSGLTESDLAEMTDDDEIVSMWGHDAKMVKAVETADYVVFHTMIYGYAGGAHGWYIAPNALTFDRQTGHKISRFIKEDAAPKMQPLIRQGLLSYFHEFEDDECMTDDELNERLMLGEDNSYIPLPYENCFPNATGDSLTFTYGEYEITCYADGMPTFALAVKDVLEFLTAEGKKTLRK